MATGEFINGGYQGQKIQVALASGDGTLNDAQCRQNTVVEAINTLTANRVVNFATALSHAFYLLVNSCLGDYTVTFKVTGQTGIEVPKGGTVLAWCNGTDLVPADAIFAKAPVALTYSASITPDASAGKRQKITATNTTAYTINAPTNAYRGAELTFDILNSSGGSMGAITWNAVFKLAGAFTNPADTKRRTITFYYDGTNWVELNRAAADI